MRLSAVLVFSVLALALTSQATQAEPMIEIGSSTTIAETNRPGPNDTLLFGSVFVNAVGAAKVIWKGVTVSGGSYAIVADSNQKAHFFTNLPTVGVDLQEVFGSKWMKAVKVNLATGGYDDNALRGTTDTYLGKLTINLTQSVMTRKTFKWEVNESVGMAGYMSRHFQISDKTAKAVPFFFSASSKFTQQISPDVVVAISIGAYVTIMERLNGPNEDRYGAVASADLNIGKQFSAGMRAEGQERQIFKDITAYETLAQVTGYVKYVLSSAEAPTKHSIQLNMTGVYDETITMEDKKLNEYLSATLQYAVAF
jgi:hypothetical protein